MKERITAIALLLIFLLGIVLAFVSLSMGNNILSGFALFFVLAGVVGAFAMRRSRQQKEEASAREKREMEKAFGKESAHDEMAQASEDPFQD